MSHRTELLDMRKNGFTNRQINDYLCDKYGVYADDNYVCAKLNELENLDRDVKYNKRTMWALYKDKIMEAVDDGITTSDILDYLAIRYDEHPGEGALRAMIRHWRKERETT